MEDGVEIIISCMFRPPSSFFYWVVLTDNDMRRSRPGPGEGVAVLGCVWRLVRLCAGAGAGCALEAGEVDAVRDGGRDVGVCRASTSGDIGGECGGDGRRGGDGGAERGV